MTSKAHDEKNPYLAGTNGARFVSMSELSKNLKAVCSNGPINVRYLYQGKKDEKEMSFLRTFWPFIDSNFLPGMEGIGGKDDQYSSLIDRVGVIPFPNNFVDPEAGNYVEHPEEICDAVGDSQFGENHKAVMMKVLLVRLIMMTTRDGTAVM